MLILPDDIPEIESWSLGPAARAFEAECDPAGRLGFRLEGHRPRLIPLGKAFAGAGLGGIAVPGAAALFRLADDSGRLAGAAFFLREDVVSLVYLGEGALFVDSRGEERPAGPGVARRIGGMGGRALLGADGDRLGFGFLMTPDNRGLFCDEALARAGDQRTLNRLELWFDAEGGAFRQARLSVEGKESRRLLSETFPHEFPVSFPSVRRRQRAERLARRQALPPGAAAPKARPRVRPGAAAAAMARCESRLKPLPATVHLSVEEMMAAILAEPDAGRRWRMIEENLREARPERSFRLLGRFADLIQEGAADWTPDRLAHVFGGQPVAALQLLLPACSGDAALALADGHPQREEFMRAWRDSEIERLLALPTNGPIGAPGEARLWLNVSPAADAKTVKRVWRVLLGFLNADHGRQTERGIHRKKDEIAKRLHAARDLLAK
jgi:hypothetical protein